MLYSFLIFYLFYFPTYSKVTRDSNQATLRQLPHLQAKLWNCWNPCITQLSSLEEWTYWVYPAPSPYFSKAIAQLFVVSSFPPVYLHTDIFFQHIPLLNYCQLCQESFFSPWVISPSFIQLLYLLFFSPCGKNQNWKQKLPSV